MQSALRLSYVPILAVVAVFGLGISTVSAQIAIPDPQIDAGYLDFFELTDGRVIDIGANGGGLDSDEPGEFTTKIDVAAQATNIASDGRLTGVVHGKFRVVNLIDQNSDTFLTGADLDSLFDVSWQVVGFDKNLGPSSAFFVANQLVGPEGSAPPWGTQAVNLPPTAGGTSSVFTILGCGGGTDPCGPFELTGSFTGFIDYTFPVSIPSVEDFNPGLSVDPDINWIITALLGRTVFAGGAVVYGDTAVYDPQVAVTESTADLLGVSLFLNAPGEQANIPIADLLTTIQIRVTPEPATLALLTLGGLSMIRRRKGA